MFGGGNNLLIVKYRFECHWSVEGSVLNVVECLSSISMRAQYYYSSVFIKTFDIYVVAAETSKDRELYRSDVKTSRTPEEVESFCDVTTERTNISITGNCKGPE